MRVKSLMAGTIVILAWTIISVTGQIVFPTDKPVTDPQPCRTNSGERGLCQDSRSCPSAVLGKLPTFCDFNRFRGLICCPKTGHINGNKPSLISNLNEISAPLIDFQCGERGQISVSFGFRSVRLTEPIEPVVARKKRSLLPSEVSVLKPPIDLPLSIGEGMESLVHSWPWMILLGRKRGPSNTFFCSAVLINKQYALTAAHCVLELEPFFARLGEHDHTISPDTITGPKVPPEDVDVEDVIFHPKYDINRGYYDIALLKLSREIRLRKEIKPVCLPWGRTANEDLVNESVTLTGWGTETFGGPLSNVLREVTVKVFDPSVCEKSYSTLPDFDKIFPSGMNRGNIVCAGDNEGGKDSCQGDSGGPMVHRGRSSSYTLAGIISKGFGCGKEDFPGLYTPLRRHETLLWIKNTAF